MQGYAQDSQRTLCHTRSMSHREGRGYYCDGLRKEAFSYSLCIGLLWFCTLVTKMFAKNRSTQIYHLTHIVMMIIHLYMISSVCYIYYGDIVSNYIISRFFYQMMLQQLQEFKVCEALTALHINLFFFLHIIACSAFPSAATLIDSLQTIWQIVIMMQACVDVRIKELNHISIQFSLFI